MCGEKRQVKFTIVMHKDHHDTLLLTVKHSVLLKHLLVFSHILALLASLGNGLPLTIKISLCILIGISFRRAARCLSGANYTISYSESLGWRLSEGDGFTSISILKSIVLTTMGLLLHIEYQVQDRFRWFEHKKTILILNDALSEKDYRCLMVKLRTTAIK